MNFFDDQNWHRRRTRLHRADCSHCNGGSGTQQSDRGLNGKWHGPLASKSAAMAIMTGFGYSDSRPCQFCKP